MSVLCVGEALIDMICTDKGTSLADGQHFLKKPGGAPTNVAAAIAALGGQVSLSAKVGNDPFGNHLIEVMNDFKVDTTHMLSDASHFTTFAFVSLMLDGERDFVFNRGADAQLSIDDIKQIDLSNYSIIHFGSATGFLPGPLKEAYFYLLMEAQRREKVISFDPNYRHLLFGDKQEEFIHCSKEFLQFTDFTKLSDEEAILITRSSTLEEAVKSLLHMCRGVFAITLGKDGTLLGYQGKTMIIPSIPIQPVDTTGAGDAFVGAILYQLDQLGQKIEEISVSKWESLVQNANKAGARTCEFMGAMEAFKHLNQSIFN